MELEEPTTEFHPVIDNRARMPEPLPVRLVAIEDVRLPAPAKIEEKLDAFYVTLLQFERLPQPIRPIRNSPTVPTTSR